MQSANLFAELEQLYSELPGVRCQGCGQCCVSPSCTLVEFLYALNGAKATLSPGELNKFILKKPEMHSGYEGNLRCVFLKDSRCLIHPARTGACRLFGHQALMKMNIAEMESCRNRIEPEREISVEYIQGWLGRLMELNRRLFPIGDEPYFLTGLNLESWLDIYFDPSHTNAFLKALRMSMLEYLDLNEFAAEYKDRTHIRNKIEKIAAFNDFIHLADGQTLIKILTSIKNDYPLTGTYFLDEAERFIKGIEDKVKKG